MVLHDDLTARDVLLADDGVVKVVDFGLARQLYTEENCTKQILVIAAVHCAAPIHYFNYDQE